MAQEVLGSKGSSVRPGPWWALSRKNRLLVVETQTRRKGLGRVHQLPLAEAGPVPPRTFHAPVPRLGPHPAFPAPTPTHPCVPGQLTPIKATASHPPLFQQILITERFSPKGKFLEVHPRLKGHMSTWRLDSSSQTALWRGQCSSACIAAIPAGPARGCVPIAGLTGLTHSLGHEGEAGSRSCLHGLASAAAVPAQAA